MNYIGNVWSVDIASTTSVKSESKLGLRRKGLKMRVPYLNIRDLLYTS